MFPQPMSRPELRSDDSRSAAIRTIEQHLLAGFPPDLALDLVLNELVVRAAEATRAPAAALALVRDGEMVCRAATGHLAPDLGVPINTRDGLSGACLQTRQPQLSVDTEFDPRVDPVISRRLGIRSILIVPVFDTDSGSQFTGILEVFSPSPAAFSHNDQKLLEAFAEECAVIRRASIELSQRKPAVALVGSDSEVRRSVSPDLAPSALVLSNRDSSESDLLDSEPDSAPTTLPEASPLLLRRTHYETWALVLGGLTILATIMVSFLIGSRIGWLRPTPSRSRISQAASPDCVGTFGPGCLAEKGSTPADAARKGSRVPTEKASARKSNQTAAASAQDELVVYEKGKVIFRMKPAPAIPAQAPHPVANSDSSEQEEDQIIEAAATKRIAALQGPATKTPVSKTRVTAMAKVAQTQSLRLSPAQAETRLLSRTEPLYPPEALTAHTAGNVVLEVHVAEDGSVSKIRAVSGDPVLARAATDAVRKWRYRPYRQHDHPSQFRTNVTLNFNLPK